MSIAEEEEDGDDEECPFPYLVHSVVHCVIHPVIELVDLLAEVLGIEAQASDVLRN